VAIIDRGGQPVQSRGLVERVGDTGFERVTSSVQTAEPRYSERATSALISRGRYSGRTSTTRPISTLSRPAKQPLTCVFATQ